MNLFIESLPAKSILTVSARLVLILFAACLSGLLFFSLTRSLVLSRAEARGVQAPDIRGNSVGADGDGEFTPAGTEDASGLLPGSSRGGISSPGSSLSADVPGSEILAQLAPWDGVDRVTILIMGLDFRDWAEGEKASRSDTMILLTIDPVTKEAGMLSIPRDLWVAIPGFSHAKINTAHYLGDAYKMPGGGSGLAVKTVEQFLGVPINYFAVIDFESFIRFIDEIGGVKIDVPEQITVDLLGSGSETKKTLQPGVQVLPGEWTLAYARARHTDGGDFDRARRQQQVIMGIRNRVLSLDMLPTLISKAPKLYQELRSGINTNLDLRDAIRLALLATQVTEDKIQRSVIDQKFVVFGRSPDNLSILIPIPDKVHAIREEVFATGASLEPLTPGSPIDKVRAEGASLAIFNGSRDPALAVQTGDHLREQGANVLEMGAADNPFSTTTIVDHTGNPFLLMYLVDLFKIQPGRISIEYQPEAPVDLELYLGYDAESVELP
jgi:polyisoprenyl-teichoic acid--peptidoglycan teichoic acid transferase